MIDNGGGPLVFPCLEFFSLQDYEDYPAILLSLSTPVLTTLKIAYSLDCDQDIMPFIEEHAISIQVLHLNQISNKARMDSSSTISLPQLRTIHLSQDFLTDPLFLLAIPTGTQAQVTDLIALGMFDEDNSILHNIFPCKHLTVPYNGTDSYVPAIIRSFPLLETLRFRVGAEVVSPHETRQSDGIVLARAMSRPDPETGEWWCPNLRHVALEFPIELNATNLTCLLVMMIEIIRRRRAQPGVAPLESLRIERAINPGFFVSPWHSTNDGDKIDSWFNENLLKFECRSYTPDNPDWFVLFQHH